MFVHRATCESLGGSATAPSGHPGSAQGLRRGRGGDSVASQAGAEGAGTPLRHKLAPEVECVHGASVSERSVSVLSE